MKKRSIILVGAMILSMVSHAQWRAGVTVGADYNMYTMDKQYQTDWQTKGRWGATVGVMGQYDVTDWLGIRADLNWTQKNYRNYRERIPIDYKYLNNYLQLPVMASLSMGGEKLRGFFNVGVYGGYWLTSHREGDEYNSVTEIQHTFSEKVEFNSDRDQRWDFGLVGGAGVEYRFDNHWAVQVESRYYHSTTSTQKQYSRVADYRYNSTIAIQAGVNYIF